MQSLILLALSALLAISMQGCGFVNFVYHTTYLWVECHTHNYRGGLSIKTKALNELPDVCNNNNNSNNSQSCIDSGTICVVNAFNETLFMATANCFAYVGKSVEFDVEPNVSATAIPDDVKEWYGENKDAVNENITVALDSVLEALRNGTCDEAKYEAKFNPRVVEYLERTKPVRPFFSFVGMSLLVATLVGGAVLFGCRRVRRARVSEPQMEGNNQDFFLE